MEVFTQQLINGITLGSIYGLIAIGYTMVFGIIGMVNFAHGDVFMVSAFIALITFLLLTTWLGVSSVAVALVIVLLVAMLLTSLANWTIERITRMVMQLQLSAVTFIAGDEGDVADSPLPESERPKEETTSGESFSSADDVFSRSSIPRASSRSATSSEIRA